MGVVTCGIWQFARVSESRRFPSRPSSLAYEPTASIIVPLETSGMAVKVGTGEAWGEAPGEGAPDVAEALGEGEALAVGETSAEGEASDDPSPLQAMVAIATSATIASSWICG